MKLHFRLFSPSAPPLESSFESRRRRNEDELKSLFEALETLRSRFKEYEAELQRRIAKFQTDLHEKEDHHCCPVCLEDAESIFCCPNCGNSICGRCEERKLDFCPFCRSDFRIRPPTRNRFAERILKALSESR